MPNEELLEEQEETVNIHDLNVISNPLIDTGMTLLRTWRIGTATQRVPDEELILPSEYELYSGLLLRANHILSNGIENYRGWEYFIPTIVLQNAGLFRPDGDLGTCHCIGDTDLTYGNSDWGYILYSSSWGPYWIEAGYRYNNMAAAEKALYTGGYMILKVFGVH